MDQSAVYPFLHRQKVAGGGEEEESRKTLSTSYIKFPPSLCSARDLFGDKFGAKGPVIPISQTGNNRAGYAGRPGGFDMWMDRS